MGESIQIQVIVPCRNAFMFHKAVQQYLTVLVTLGMVTPDIVEWGKTLEWPPLDEQIDTKWPEIRFQLFNVNYFFDARIVFMCFDNDQERSHMSLELIFDADRVQLGNLFSSNDGLFYIDIAGRMFWHIIYAMSKNVQNDGCYLTNPLSATQSWKAAQGKECNFWDIELSLVPQDIYSHFLPVPENFAVKRQDTLGIFAQKERWIQMPWTWEGI